MSVYIFFNFPILQPAFFSYLSVGKVQRSECVIMKQSERCVCCLSANVQPRPRGVGKNNNKGLSLRTRRREIESSKRPSSISTSKWMCSRCLSVALLSPSLFFTLCFLYWTIFPPLFICHFLCFILTFPSSTFFLSLSFCLAIIFLMSLACISLFCFFILTLFLSNDLRK